MTLLEAFTAFLDYKATYIKAKSVKSYKESISVAVKFIGPDTDLLAVSAASITAFLTSVNNDKKLGKGTKNNYIKSFKIFVRWLCSEFGFDAYNPDKIKIPKMPKKNVYMYSDDEILQLLDACETTVAWITLRNKAIIMLLLETGIRLSEIASIKRSDLLSQNHCFRIVGKGDKERFVPCGSTVIASINDYLNACPFHGADFVFFDKSGNALSANAVQQFLNILKHKVPFECSAHRFRHNFATNFVLHDLEDGGDGSLTKLQLLLGHSELKTTYRYYHDAVSKIAVSNSYSRFDNMVRL